VVDQLAYLNVSVDQSKSFKAKDKQKVTKLQVHIRNGNMYRPSEKHMKKVRNQLKAYKSSFIQQHIAISTFDAFFLNLYTKCSLYRDTLC